MYDLYILKEINGKVEKIKFDFYDVANCIEASEEVKHTFKKLWRTNGSTGRKSRVDDLKECIAQIEKEIHRITLLEKYTDQEAKIKQLHWTEQTGFKNEPKITLKNPRHEVTRKDCIKWAQIYPDVAVYHVDFPRKEQLKACDWSYDLAQTGYRLQHDDSPLWKTVRKWKNEIKRKY